MKLKTWIGLLLCNVAWAINPSIAKRIILEVGPHHTAWFKYSVALATYCIVMIGMRLVAHRRDQSVSMSQVRLFMPFKLGKDFLAVATIGFATCFIAPMTQMLGLEASSAVNNSILVTFEPIFTVLFGWLIFREQLHKSHFFSFLMAITGFVFLSNLVSSFAANDGNFLTRVGYGDLILLAAIAGESIYSVLARNLVKAYPGPMVFGTAMLVGVLLLSSVVLSWKGLPDFQSLSLKGWISVAWLGIMGTAVPYLYWLHALNQSLSLGSVVLTLFLQPLVGTAYSCIFSGRNIWCESNHRMRSHSICSDFSSCG